MGIIGNLLRIFLGLLGVIFNLFGIMMLVFEIMVWLPHSARATQPLGQVWFQHDPFFSFMQSHSIQLAQVIIERKLQWPELWSPGITTILNWPSWVALLVVGVTSLIISKILMVLARRRKS